MTTTNSRVERLGTERIGTLLLEMSSQTTFSLLVYSIYSITDTYFLSVGINSLAAAGASIISPVLTALGAVATTVAGASSARAWASPPSTGATRSNGSAQRMDPDVPLVRTFPATTLVILPSQPPRNA